MRFERWAVTRIASPEHEWHAFLTGEHPRLNPRSFKAHTVAGKESRSGRRRISVDMDTLLLGASLS
jgi:hypothetical protein